MEIMAASARERLFLAQNDRNIRPEELNAAIAQGRVLTAWENGAPIGWLRWNWFWDNTPFLNLLYVLVPYRGRGCGRLLLEAWEREMQRRGEAFVLTSTRADETAQHFYRRFGYTDSGALLLPGEPLEIIFVKRLAARGS